MNDFLPARFSTGNRYVSLPDVRTRDCAVESLSFLHSGLRAAVELHGSEEFPFLKPHLAVDGVDVPLEGASWEHLNYWVPKFHLKTEGIELIGHVFAPLEHKGIIWVLEVRSTSHKTLKLTTGWQGCWQDTYHAVNLCKPMSGARCGGFNKRYENAWVMEFRYSAPLFAVALLPGQPMKTEVLFSGKASSGGCSGVSVDSGEALCFRLTQDIILGPGESRTLVLNLGVGPEETSAVSGAVDLHRHGWQHMLNRLLKWLDHRTYRLEDERLSKLINLNSFFSHFFSFATSIDTEQLAIVSSRSSRYHASTAYKDRDAMLWTLPAVLQIEPLQARRLLEYAFTVQLRNVGLCSRFIDGAVLELGFGLDALCAPVRALWMYVYQTGDMSVVFDRRVQTGLNRIQQLLSSAKHPKLSLYETMLLPSGDMSDYPIVTYDNVLVWRVLRDLALLYDRIRDIDRTQEMMERANSVKKAIMSHCVVAGPYGDMFAWSVDLDGNHELNDDPSGSLQLLSWLDFCSPDLPVYKNTVRWIHSEHNPHSFASSRYAAPGNGDINHPSIVAVANDLITGRKTEALRFLQSAYMDDLIACESVNEDTGIAASGLACASVAGYLAYALASALGVKTESAPVIGRDVFTAEKLAPSPPEIRDSIDL